MLCQKTAIPKASEKTSDGAVECSQIGYVNSSFHKGSNVCLTSMCVCRGRVCVCMYTPVFERFVYVNNTRRRQKTQTKMHSRVYIRGSVQMLMS